MSGCFFWNTVYITGMMTYAFNNKNTHVTLATKTRRVIFDHNFYISWWIMTMIVFDPVFRSVNEKHDTPTLRHLPRAGFIILRWLYVWDNVIFSLTAPKWTESKWLPRNMVSSQTSTLPCGRKIRPAGRIPYVILSYEARRPNLQLSAMDGGRAGQRKGIGH